MVMQNKTLICALYALINNQNASNMHANKYSFPVAQLVEHGANNAKIMGSVPRESKS